MMTGMLTARGRAIASIGFDVALIIAFIASLAPLGACNPFWFLPGYKEGSHRIQATTQADIDRGVAVAACLDQWARGNGYPSAEYSDADFTRLTIVRVGDPGVVGTRSNGASFLTDEREAADTIFINEGVSASEFVAVERHGDVHVVQEKHRELIGANGDIHWAPPWDYCRVLRVIVSSG